MFFSAVFSPSCQFPKGQPHHFLSYAESIVKSLIEFLATNGTVRMQVWKQSSWVKER